MLKVKQEPKPPGKTEERRAKNRTTSVYRPVIVQIEGFTGFCLIRNLSPGGMMGTIYTTVAANRRASIHFAPDLDVAGTIVWCQNGRIGIRFDGEIDVKELLQKMTAQFGGNRPSRSPRLQLRCEGELKVENRILPCALEDISQRGAKIHGPSLRVGDEVTVRLPGLDDHKAIVRWTRSRWTGVNFIRPLGFEELARWVVQQHSVKSMDTASGDDQRWSSGGPVR